MRILERFARIFIYRTGDEALARAQALKEIGIYSTINPAIEDASKYYIAFYNMIDVCSLLSNIRDWGLGEYTSISVKMSALGMDFDKVLCESYILRILEFSKTFGVEVQFDVEGKETHDFYYRMVHSYNLNGAIQAKSPPILLPKKPPRIVKGAYKARIRRSSSYLRAQILDWVNKYMYWNDGIIIVGSHDSKLIEKLVQHKDKIELQYLHGVKEEEFRRYKEMGFKVREYIPYGNSWYPYMIRRIKEDPWGKLKIFLSSWRRK